jgi:hypothetical protein
MPEPIFMKLGMYIMALEPISKTYFINPFHPYLHTVARQRLGKTVTAAMDIYATIEKNWTRNFI